MKFLQAVYVLALCVGIGLQAKQKNTELLFSNDTVEPITIFMVPQNGSSARSTTLEPSMQGGIQVPGRVAAVVIQNPTTLMDILLFTNEDGINSVSKKYWGIYIDSSNAALGSQLAVTKSENWFQAPPQQASNSASTSKAQ